MVSPKHEQMSFMEYDAEVPSVMPIEGGEAPFMIPAPDISDPYRAVHARNREVVERRGEDLRKEQTGVATPGTEVQIQEPPARTLRLVRPDEKPKPKYGEPLTKAEWREVSRIGMNGVRQAREILRAVKKP